MKLLLIFIFFCLSLTSFANESWKKYPYQAEGSEIIFPEDEGRHSMKPNLEWWYTVIHAKGETTGHEYSILVTHFNNKFRFFTIANKTLKNHISGTTRGKLNSSFDYLDLTHETKYGVDSFRSKRDAKGKLIPFEYEIKTHHDKMKLQVDLVSIKKPLMVQGTGYVNIGRSGKSYYYSNTRLKAKGTLTYKNTTEKFTGTAWMDHQWGPFFISPVRIGKLFESYEWFCIHLEDGRDIMISNIFDRNFNLPQTKDYGGVEIVDKLGGARNTFIRKFTRTKFWQDPVSKHFMSIEWKLEVPEWDLSLTLKPDFKEQMVRFPLGGDFWEGSISVIGTIEGKAVRGRSFGELIHRFEIPKVKVIGLKRQYKKNGQVNLVWKIKNPDAGNPLHYRVGILLNSRSVLLSKKLSEQKFSFKIGDYRKKGEKLSIKVYAYSVDETIRGEISKEIKIVR